MFMSHYLIFKNNYVVPYFNYGMLCYVTISTFSWYVSMIGFMEKNIDDDDSSEKFIKYFIFKIWIMLIFVYSLLSNNNPRVYITV